MGVLEEVVRRARETIGVRIQVEISVAAKRQPGRSLILTMHSASYVGDAEVAESGIERGRTRV